MKRLDHLNTIKWKDCWEDLPKPKRHGCIDRKYYTLLKYYKSSGITHNCVSIKHVDTNFELFENDDPNTNLGYLINWGEKNCDGTHKAHNIEFENELFRLFEPSYVFP